MTADRRTDIQRRLEGIRQLRCKQCQAENKLAQDQDI
jgi:hypothetical protein